MGLADDEGLRTPSPFTPAPEKSRWPAFLVALLLVLALAAWVWHAQPGLDATMRGLARSVATPGTTHAPSAPVASPLPPATSTRMAPALGQTVSKCVFKGKTTYSDGPCPDGAKAEQLAVRSDVNLMEAPMFAHAEPVRSAAPAPVPTPAPVVTQAPQPDLDKNDTCPGLARYIEELDAWARQPQSGEMQDWITARKREARDRQFRLKC